jgi:arylformamidase
MSSKRSFNASRRRFIETIGLMGLVSACTSKAPHASPVKAPALAGPKVFLDMDQAALDAAYTQSVWAPNSREVLARYKSGSEAFLRETSPPIRMTYGSSDIESLDIYVPPSPRGKIHIFIHGGAWSGGTAAEYAFVAEMLLSEGVHVVIPDFSRVQDFNGDLIPIADQIRRAISYTYQNAARFGGDPDQIFVSGHSSGGHLAATALTTNWDSYGVPRNIIKGALLCSGMYDMKPVRLSARSKYINFTDTMEDSLSPQRHLQMISTTMVVVYGTNESPEFQRQARDFSAAAKKSGLDVQLLVAKDYNHFEVLETLARRDGVLGKAALKQMELTSGE